MPKYDMLVVDDDLSILKTAQMYIKKFNVMTATNGREAQEILNKKRFDVIVSDYNMPECNGVELKTYLNRQGIKIPFIATSGEFNKSNSMDYANLQVYKVIEKPFICSDIEDIAEKAVVDYHDKLKVDHLAVIGRNAGHIIHDLNNNLTISKFASQVGMQTPIEKMNEATKNKLFSKTLRSCDQMVSIVERYKKLVNEDNKLELHEISCLVWLREFEDDFRGICGNLKIDFLAEIDNDCLSGSVMIDKPILNQVLLNLLSNSVDAIKDLDNKKIEVQVRETHQKLYFKIMDSGPGVPAEIVPKLFNESVSTKGSSGTGMGLSYCRDILNLHFGKISYSPENGKTCFVVEIPMFKGGIPS